MRNEVYVVFKHKVLLTCWFCIFGCLSYLVWRPEVSWQLVKWGYGTEAVGLVIYSVQKCSRSW